MPEPADDALASIASARRITRLTPAEMDQIEAALDEEPRVIPELAALIHNVRDSRIQHAAQQPTSAR